MVHRWTEEEYEILRSKYQHNLASAQEIADILELRTQQVLSQIYHLADKEGRAQRRSQKERINEDGDRGRYCPHCQEWWPSDTEFYCRMGVKNKDGSDRLQSWCIACQIEQQRIHRPPKGRSHLTEEERHQHKIEYSRQWRIRHRGVCKDCGTSIKSTSKTCCSCYLKLHNPWRK